MGYTRQQLEALGARPLTGTRAPGAIPPSGPQQPTEQPSNDILGDFAMGAGKSALGVATGFARTAQDLGQRFMAGIDPTRDLEQVRAETGIPSLDPRKPQGQAVTEELTPTNSAQRAGKFAGDVASFVIPGTAAARATKGLGLAARAGAGALSDAAVQSSQSGTAFDKSVRDTAIISMAFPYAGRIISKGLELTGKARNAFAGKVINSLIRPLSKDLSYGKNPGRGVVAEKITAGSFEELAEKIGQAQQKTGAQLDQLYTQSAERFDLTDALKPIDDAIAEAKKSPRTNAALMGRLEDLKADLLKQETDEIGNVLIQGRQLEGLTAKEAFEFKKDIGALTKYTGNMSDDSTVNRALQRTYSNIKKQLDTIPGVHDLNERYADLTSAKIATEYRDKITQRLNLIGPMAKLGGGATAIAGLFTGNPVAAIGGLSLAMGEQLSSTPAFKTRLAKWLSTASSQEKRQLIEKAPWIRGLLLEILVDEPDTTPSPTTR